MIGDKSPRTRAIAMYTIFSILAILLLVGGGGGMIFSNGYYKHIESQSSTAKGTELQFQRSDATMTISDVYVDENEDVLIARFSNISPQLPFRGDNYKVYISSPSLDESHEEMDILFGRMSTDGDAFLVIPKPTDEVYTVYLMNTNYLGVPTAGQPNDEMSTGVTTITDEQNAMVKQSMSSALSSYQYSGNNTIDSYQVEDDFSDVAAFRLTKNPALNDETHVPTVVNASLLDDTNTFDFATFFETVFQSAVINQLNGQYSSLQNQASGMESAIDEYTDRLAANPNDQTAIDELDRFQKQLERLEDDQRNIAQQINAYNALTYSPDLFVNLQTTAEIIQPK